MLSRRKSIDEQTKGKDRSIQNALLKLSTANAFVKARQASITRGHGVVDTPLHGPSISWDPGSSSGAGLPFNWDDFPPAEPSPEQLSPYYGFYADYEEVMDLLHTAPVADGSSRRQLGSLCRQQVVHVAHLGMGACCSVDLVALHTPDGGRVLAAAKSCYLPPSDPRMRASLREAELLHRCADCPFIMQLLALLQEPPEEEPAAAADAGGGGSGSVSPSTISPHDSMRRDSLRRVSADPYAGGGGGGGAAAATRFSGERGGGGADPQLAAMQSSPAYQAWLQWRGGGGAEDLQRQLLSRISAAAASSPGGLSGGENGSFSVGSLRLGSMTGDLLGAGSGGSFASTAWDGGGPSPSASCSGAYGGGWAFGGGGEIGTAGFGFGGSGCSGSESGTGGHAHPHTHPRSAGQRLPRRGSLEIVNMYSGCSAMSCASGPGPSPPPGLGCAAAGTAAPPEAAAAVAAAEPPVMTTLLLGWARCGDLRRLVQLMMSRSAPHAATPKHGGSGAAGLPPLMPEDAARFYTGCLVLALEHLHGRMNTVHRDLKLANLLLLSNGYAVVGDLGTAVDLSSVPGGRLNARVGSPGHMAPECRDRDEAGYDTSADMWSLGACLYSLLTGHLPAGTAGPPSRAWSPPMSRHWSRELQDLLARLLAWSPSQRPSAGQLLTDPWFRGFNWGALRAQRMQPPNSTPWRELLWWPKENKHLL